MPYRLVPLPSRSRDHTTSGLALLAFRGHKNRRKKGPWCFPRSRDMPKVGSMGASYWGSRRYHIAGCLYVIPEPHATMQGAATWRLQLYSIPNNRLRFPHVYQSLRACSRGEAQPLAGSIPTSDEGKLRGGGGEEVETLILGLVRFGNNVYCVIARAQAQAYKT